MPTENPRVFDPSDTPEMIAKCLSCTKVECNDCLRFTFKDDPRGRGARVQHIIDADALIDLYNKGLSVEPMGRRLGFRAAMLRGRLSRLGLPFKIGEERPVLTLDFFRSLPGDKKFNYTWRDI